MRNSVLVPEERARLSGTSLKIIACISMLISHIIASGVWIQTAGLLPVKWETVSALYITGSILQLTAGRIAFPIFGFLLVEGAQKTHNKKRYLDWLGIGVLVSEIPFDLALFGTLHDEQHQSVYATLMLALMAIFSIQEAEKMEQKWKRWLCTILLTAFFSAVAYFLKTDYGETGVLYIILLYLLRNTYVEVRFGVALTVLVAGIGAYEAGAFLVAPLLLFYDGTRGRCNTEWGKLLFYVFYPAHLILLYVISRGMLPTFTEILSR